MELLKQILESAKRQNEIESEEIGPSTMFIIDYYIPMEKISNLKKLMKLDLIAQKELDGNLDFIKEKFSDINSLDSAQQTRLINMILRSRILRELVEIEFFLIKAQREGNLKNNLFDDYSSEKLFLVDLLNLIENQEIDGLLLDPIDDEVEEMVAVLDDDHIGLKKLVSFCNQLRKKFNESENKKIVEIRRILHGKRKYKFLL